MVAAEIGKVWPLAKGTLEYINLKLFETIDNVIDLQKLLKFRFGKFVGDWGTYTQHS